MTDNKSTGARLRADAASVLYAILERHQSSRHVLPDKLTKYRDPRDKALLQEVVFGCLRQLPTLQFWLRQLLTKPLKGNKKVIEHLILVGFYQLAFTRVSQHAAVAETVSAAQLLKGQSLKGLINALLRQFLREELSNQKPNSLAAQSGFPNWLYNSIVEHYPDSSEQIIHEMNTKAPIWLRVNTQRTTLADFCTALNSANVTYQTVSSHPQAVIVNNVGDITKIPGFDEGWFAVQDGAAQLAAHYLSPQNGELILDCCAAPGGKTGHLKELAPQATCIALDNDAQRLERVSENLARLHHQVKVICADAEDTASWWDGKLFDRILLDAPCSATGVIRRHPDIRWLRQKSDIETLVNLQSKLLDALWPLLNSGGTLLFATCSILPEENVQQIAKFLKRYPDAALSPIVNGESPSNPGRQILPGDEQMDGFYYARLIKS